MMKTFGACMDRIAQGAHRAEIAMVILLWLLCILFTPAVIEHPLYAAAFAALVLMGWLLLVHPKTALFAAVGGIVLVEEFNLAGTEAFFQSGIGSSVLALRVFGVNIVDALTLMFLVPALVRAWTDWYRYGKSPFRPMDAFFLPIVAVYIFGAVQGLFHALTPKHYAWEAREILTILSWYFVASRTLTARRDVVILVAVLLGVFHLKSLLFAWRVLAGKGLFYGFDFYRPALGSDVSMTAVPLIAAFAATVLVRQAPRWFRPLMMCLLAYWSVWLIGSLGRSVYLTTAVALLILFLAVRKEARPKDILQPLAAAAAGAAAFAFLALTEANRALVSTMLSTAFNWVDAILVYQDLSMAQRVMEFLNISETLSRAGAWLWGFGWGAPWSEIVVHHPIDVASFEYMEAVRGVHTSAHIDALYYLLKVGIIGTLVLYAAYARFVVAAVREFRRPAPPADRVALAAMIGAFVVFLPNFVYFVKLKLILGILFGCLSCIRAAEART
ncbi:MAG: hypothetical protein QHI48_04290 [Bacteroidota bacterium]|nr:hypothetical protein [Bacteroidota bacterium]